MSWLQFNLFFYHFFPKNGAKWYATKRGKCGCLRCFFPSQPNLHHQLIKLITELLSTSLSSLSTSLPSGKLVETLKPQTGKKVLSCHEAVTTNHDPTSVRQRSFTLCSHLVKNIYKFQVRNLIIFELLYKIEVWRWPSLQNSW